MGHAVNYGGNMFGVLIESRAGKQRRTGGAVLSVVLHAALIGAAILLTKKIGSATTAPEPPPPPVIYTKVDNTPHEQPRRAQDATTSRTSLPVPPDRIIVVAPTDIPTTLPPIPKGAADFDPANFFVISGDSLVRRGGRSGSLIGDRNQIFKQTNVERIATLVRPVRPHYPDALRLAGISGRVVMRFVIDTAGVVEPESIETMESTHARFENSVRDALSRMRFKPAEVDDKPVRMLVEMPFEFKIGEKD